MDEAGVDIAVLRIPCWQEWLPLDMCKTVNDGLAEHVKRHPERFRAVAVVPPWGTKECLKEVERFDLIADRVRRYLERNIYFDISHAPPWGKPQLECAVKVLGAGHILYGGSYPLRRAWFLKGIEFVKDLEISEEEKSLILSENAAKLFNIRSS